jgi:hypothetical protein
LFAALLDNSTTNKLVPDLPHVHYGGLEFGADFVVKDLDINIVSTVGEAAHDGGIGSQLVFVRPVNIRGIEDCIAAAVEGNGDVLVAAVSQDGELGSLPVSLVLSLASENFMM